MIHNSIKLTLLLFQCHSFDCLYKKEFFSLLIFPFLLYDEICKWYGMCDIAICISFEAHFSFIHIKMVNRLHKWKYLYVQMKCTVGLCGLFTVSLPLKINDFHSFVQQNKMNNLINGHQIYIDDLSKYDEISLLRKETCSERKKERE